jgi:hypothetical protein
MSSSYKNPASSAMPYLNEIPSTIAPYFKPYQQAGSQAMQGLGNQYHQLLGLGSGLQNQYSQLMNNPSSVMQGIGSQYHQSPGYQWEYNQGQEAEANRADAGGYAGTPQDEQQASNVAEQQADQNYYKYMSQALGLYNQGLHGAHDLYREGLRGTNRINDMGFRSNTDMASALAQTLMAQAHLAYTGQAGQNMHNGMKKGATTGGVLGGIGDVLGAAMKFIPK